MDTTKIPTLVGTINFVEWHCEFIRAAKDQDVWDLLSGEYKPLFVAPQPDHKEYLLRTRSGLEPRVRNSRTGADPVDDRNVSEFTIQTRTLAAVACFQHDRESYKIGRQKVKRARALIKASVSPLAARTIRSMVDPVAAYKVLNDNYKVPAEVAVEKLSLQLRDVSLGQSENSVERYLARIFDICSDLADYGQNPKNATIAKHILAGLPDCYQALKARHGWMSDADIDRADLESLYADVLIEAARQEQESRSLMD